MKKLWLFGALALAAGCGPSGKLAGKVLVANGDSSLASVVAVGPATRVAPVTADGTYTFDALPDGVYSLEAYAPSTLETRLSVRAEIKNGTGTVEDIAFVGAGRITGRATAPAGVSGAEVFVSGTTVRVQVADDGAFTIEKVAAGPQTLVAARDGYQPVYAKVNVPYNGTLENQTLALSEVAHGSGRITGHAYFFNKANHAAITVTVEGTQISAQTQADGSYTLTGVPLGWVNLVASATGYEPAKAWNVLSAQGGEARVEDLRLFYATNRFLGTVGGYSLSPDQKTLLFVGQPEFDDNYFLYQLNLATQEAPKLLMRVGATGAGISSVIWQKDSKKAAVTLSYTSDILYALDVTSSAFKAITTRYYPGTLAITANKVFFLEGSTYASPNPLLSVFDFGASTTTVIERVERAATYVNCTWWPGANVYFAASTDGRVAYHTPVTPGPQKLKLWASGTASELSAGVSCIGFHGDGTTLLALNLSGTNFDLVTYGAGTTTTALHFFPKSQVAFPGEYGFTGDDLHVWVFRNDGTNYLLEAYPVVGSAKTTLYSGPIANPVTYELQPGGNQFAIRDSTAAINVKAANNATAIRTYTSAAATPAFGYSPKGKRFFTNSTVEDLTITASVDHLGAALGKRATAGTQPEYAYAEFAPQETAVVWQADPPTVLRVTKFGGLSTDLAAKLPARFVTYFSPNDKYLLMDENDSDRVFNVDTGNPLVLGRNLTPLSVRRYNTGGGLGTYDTFWLADSAKLLFREGLGGSRILTANPETGELKHIADYETAGITFIQLADSPQLLVIDTSSTGQPPGIYQLNP
jgi:WD40 repeat protein